MRPLQTRHRIREERGPDHQKHQKSEQVLGVLDVVVEPGMFFVATFRRPHAQRRTEHRQETPPTHEFTHPVRREQGGHRARRFGVSDELVISDVQAVERLADQPAQEPSGHRADGGLAYQVPGQPGPDPGPRAVVGREIDGQIDEREGERVVEPGLGGEGEAGLVGFVAAVVPEPRPLHLDVGGEDRIGGGQDGTEQDRHHGGQAQNPPAQERDPDNRQRHPHQEEAPGGGPTTQAQWSVQRQPDTVERHDHGDLGHPFREFRVLDHVDEPGLRGHEPADDHPHTHHDDGRAQDLLGEQSGKQRADHQRCSDHRVDQVSVRHEKECDRSRARRATGPVGARTLTPSSTAP